MSAEEFNSQTDPEDLRNIIYQMDQRIKELELSFLDLQNVSEISKDGRGLVNGLMETTLDGTLKSWRINKNSFNTSPGVGDIDVLFGLPLNALTEDNIIEMVLDGHLVQNTGVDQNFWFELFLVVAAAGSDNVNSNSQVAITSLAGIRGFTYRVRIAQAPSLGNNVIVNEEFLLENATGSTIKGFARTTTTKCVAVTALDEFDNIELFVHNNTTSTLFRTFIDMLTVRIIDGISPEEKIWYSQPINGNNLDTFIQLDSPTTNAGGNTLFTVGESNAGAGLTRRSLIKFADIANIPVNAVISAAYLHLTIEGDISSNSRVFEIYRVLRDWVEMEATWNIYKTSSNWGTAGCGNSSTDYDGAIVWASKTLAGAEPISKVITFNLDAAEFTKFVNGTYPNYGWLIKAQTELDDAYRFHSGNSASPEYAPILEVVYTVTE